MKQQPKRSDILCYQKAWVVLFFIGYNYELLILSIISPILQNCFL